VLSSVLVSCTLRDYHVASLISKTMNDRSKLENIKFCVLSVRLDADAVKSLDRIPRR
jgi:hypothetical protein